MTTPDDTTPDHTTPDTQGDPQSHVDHDPANEPDADTDPAHDTGKDEGWESEGGANPTGPATD
jgi:hypothetical protein